MKRIYDFLIIGGGIVGSSLAYGMSEEKSLNIAMIDAYDYTHRATVGNYGLTWMQSKGYKNQSYTRMTERAINYWQDFANELEDRSKIDLEFVQNGGLHFCFNQEEFENRASKIENINSYYENISSKSVMLNKNETRELYPRVGKEVYGTSFNKKDGYLNPLKLWLAQLKIAKEQGVKYTVNFCVEKIEKKDGIYEVISKEGKQIKAKQLIFSAGLANKYLAKQVGIDIPIKPEKGHILVTQKIKNLNLLPSLNIRQSKDGSLLLGYSNEDVGFDDSVNEYKVQEIIKKALKILPELKNINILRSWSSLRIMPEDGKSIYDRKDNNLHIVSTHSAVTFAPIHVKELSKCIIDGKMNDNLKYFSLKRFKKEEK